MGHGRVLKSSEILTSIALVAACGLASAQQASAPEGRGGAPPRDGGPYTGDGPSGSARAEPGVNLMNNPYRMTENWPTLNPGMKWGPAINFLPDNKGGTWALLRTEPPIVHFDASGKIVQSFGEGLFTDDGNRL